MVLVWFIFTFLLLYVIAIGWLVGGQWFNLQAEITEQDCLCWIHLKTWRPSMASLLNELWICVGPIPSSALKGKRWTLTNKTTNHKRKPLTYSRPEWSQHPHLNLAWSPFSHFGNLCQAFIFQPQRWRVFHGIWEWDSKPVHIIFVVTWLVSSIHAY
jgi:hypothetical protein